MNKTAIIGIGMTPVSEYWDKSLRELAYESAADALTNAGNPQIDAIYIANAYGSTFNKQSQLGSLIADYLGFQIFGRSSIFFQVFSQNCPFSTRLYFFLWFWCM